MEPDPGNKLREEPGVDKVGFHITVVKRKNENSKGDLRARVGGRRVIYLFKFNIKKHPRICIRLQKFTE